MPLKNLHDYIEDIIEEFNVEYFAHDVELPESFKSYVKSHRDGDKYTFNKYTAIIYTGLSIYCPNQWFYIAAYFCQLYPLLQEYRDKTISALCVNLGIKEQKVLFENVKGRYDEFMLQFDQAGYDEETKNYLWKFVSDYSWWKGGKGIERQDFYYSPILSSAKLVNASQSYVAEISKYLIENPDALTFLQEEISKKDIIRPIISKRKLTDFILTTVRYFDKYNHLNSLAPFAGETSPVKMQGDGFSLTGMFLESTIEDVRQRNLEHTRWFEDLFHLKERNVYLSTQWNANGNYQLTLVDFIKMIQASYGNCYYYKLGPNGEHQLWKGDITRQQVTISDLPSDFPDTYTQYITAIKTKPFVLLAGISGTGKSRIVRQLARACDTLDDSPWTVPVPQNFEMIQVRPDWHDSSELLGYESRISGKTEYVVKDFVKFIVKAWLHEEVPFFLCLDEMNLAPVEQYFAEYLSVVESRYMDEQGNIVCDPLIKLNRQHCQSIVNEMLAPSESDDTDAHQLNQAEEMMILLEDMDYTLPLPKNLIVMGTVNMDETTFSFSRKVLDRAMTIEMNEVDLKAGLDKTEKECFHINAQDILPNAVEGKDVYAANRPLCDRVINFLEEVNEVLEGTPFKIAYRTRNEFLLYAVNRGEEHFEETLDEMTSMKILSRIEGDQDKVGDVLDQLKTVLEKNNIPADGKSLPKITEMSKKLDKGYTSYWS